MDKTAKKEFLLYFAIVVFLVLIIILNNTFWKLGKQEENVQTTQNNKITYFKSNNIIYDVPFEEEWLD